MREIKFRGKSLKNGEWIFGLLNKDIKGHCRIQFDPKYFSVIVDPATVGQFTGLKDKNGREIYDGDIVSVNNERMAIVCYEDAGFVIKSDFGEIYMRGIGVHMYPDRSKIIEIIGSIHDNPELIKTE